MTDDTFKELVVNFLNAIYLQLKYSNKAVYFSQYLDDKIAVDKAISELLAKGDTDGADDNE